MLVSAIIADLRNRLNDNIASGNTVSEYLDAEFIKFINDALREFCRIMKCYTLSETTPAATSHTLVGIFQPDTVLVDGVIVNESTFRELLDSYATAVGEPRYYYVENNKVNLFPKEDATTYNIQVVGYATKAITATTDNIDFLPTDYFSILIDLCEYKSIQSRITSDGNNLRMQYLLNNINTFYNIEGKLNASISR